MVEKLEQLTSPDLNEKLLIIGENLFDKKSYFSTLPSDLYTDLFNYLGCNINFVVCSKYTWKEVLLKFQDKDMTKHYCFINIDLWFQMLPWFFRDSNNTIFKVHGSYGFNSFCHNTFCFSKNNANELQINITSDFSNTE